MKVVATQMGFFDGSLRNPGDTFEVAEGAKAHWFTPAEPKAVEAAKPKPAAKSAPKALSEMQAPGKTFNDAHKGGDLA